MSKIRELMSEHLETIRENRNGVDKGQIRKALNDFNKFEKSFTKLYVSRGQAGISPTMQELYQEFQNAKVALAKLDEHLQNYMGAAATVLNEDMKVGKLEKYGDITFRLDGKSVTSKKALMQLKAELPEIHSIIDKTFSGEKVRFVYDKNKVKLGKIFKDGSGGILYGPSTIKEDVSLDEGKITKASSSRVYASNKDRVGKTYIDDTGNEVRNSVVIEITSRYMNLAYVQLDSVILRYQNFSNLKTEEFRIYNKDGFEALKKLKVK